ncbi:MAG: hypothetical protein ACLQVN_21450 [Bryobacteraceae bacterium]
MLAEAIRVAQRRQIAKSAGELAEIYVGQAASAPEVELYLAVGHSLTNSVDL